jgi:Tfp pilus assembly protein PilF
MHVVSRRNNLVLVALAAGSITGLVAQQEPNAPGAPAGGAPQQPPATAAPATASNPGGAPGTPQGGNGGATGTTLNYLYNTKPGDGTAAQGGANSATAMQQKMMAADMLSGAENLIPAELESYLNSAEVPADEVKKYEQLFKVTVDMLRDKRQASAAVANLYSLSDYPWDAGISRLLANRVLAFWDMRNNQSELDAANRQLQARVKDSSRNADMISEEVWRKDQERMRQNSMGNKSQAQKKDDKDKDKNSKAFLPSPKDAQDSLSGVMGKLQLTEEYFTSLDSRARMRLNEREMEELEKKAKADFKKFVDVLFQGKRHYHARIAADFYRVLFGDGDLPPELAAQAAASSEIIRQTESDIEVFKFKVEGQKVASASKILREAFFRSQYHPALQAVMRTQKLPVADYYEQLQQVQAMIEAKDFVKLEVALQRIEKDAVDFDGTKPRALVEAVKRESQMRLGMAKLAAQNGNLDKAMEEFRAAATAWPGNPDLEKASQQFFASQDMKTQGTDDFERAIKDENYRLIFENQLQFAGAVHGNPQKEQQLKKALEKVKAAEIAYEKASLMDRGRDPFGAWETLELASEDWPEDSKLNKMRADVSVRASEFVASVSRARDAEKRGQDGFALTWYLNAQRQYPPSQLANDGIERMSDAVLGKDPRPSERNRTEEKPATSASTDAGGGKTEVASGSRRQ